MPSAKKFTIAVDFDGTIVDHRFPDIGDPVPGAFRWMQYWKELGAVLILNTIRSDGQQSGDVLTMAVNFCASNGVIFDSVNNNPSQPAFSTSPKVYAHAYVDDNAVGCPLRDNPRMGGKPFVDWDVVGPLVEMMIKKYSVNLKDTC